LRYLFILFAGMAIGCAVSMVAQRNPLYGAISLIGVFVSLACLYVTLAAPLFAAVQVIVYAARSWCWSSSSSCAKCEDEERLPLRLPIAGSHRRRFGGDPVCGSGFYYFLRASVAGYSDDEYFRRGG